jgi:hypothetical protein
MNRLPLLNLLLPLALAACGSTTTTPATTDDVAADDASGSDATAADASADVSATDAAADASGTTGDAVVDTKDVTPTAACKSDCDAQKKDCATIDLTQCYGLCDYVVPGLKSAECIAKQTAVWECEAVALFVCATDTNVVGALKDANACKAEHDARDVACPK